MDFCPFVCTLTSIRCTSNESLFGSSLFKDLSEIWRFHIYFFGWKWTPFEFMYWLPSTNAFASDSLQLIIKIEFYIYVTFFSLPVNLNFIKSRLLLHLILQNIFIFVDSRPGWGEKSEKCHTSVKANSVNPFISYCTRVCSLSWETSDNPFKFFPCCCNTPDHPTLSSSFSHQILQCHHPLYFVLEYICWHRRSDDDNPKLWKTITTHMRTSDNLIIHADLSEASSLDLSFLTLHDGERKTKKRENLVCIKNSFTYFIVSQRSLGGTNASCRRQNNVIDMTPEFSVCFNPFFITQLLLPAQTCERWRRRFG